METRYSGFYSKIGSRFVIESMRGRCNAKNNIGFTGLHEILGRDYGIEEPYWGPSKRGENHAYSKLIFFLFLTAVFS